jgi:hypothetical protein
MHHTHQNQRARMVRKKWLHICEARTTLAAMQRPLKICYADFFGGLVFGFSYCAVDDEGVTSVAVEERPTIFSSVLNLCRFAHW